MLQSIDLKSEGSLIDAELIVKAKNRGFAIQQMGLDYFPRIRGTSHLSSPSVIIKIFRELWTLYPEMRERQHVILSPAEGEGPAASGAARSTDGSFVASATQDDSKTDGSFVVSATQDDSTDETTDRHRR